MKRIIMTLAIAASSLFAFAGEGNVSKNVLNAFNKEFTGATEISWSAGEDFFKAEFVMNDQYITAFYSSQGELMGISRNISSLNLPLALQTKLRKEYSAYWISDLIEVSNSEGTNYYVTLESAEKRMTLKSEGVSNWELYKKTAKL